MLCKHRNQLQVVHDFETHNNHDECGDLSLQHHGVVSDHLEDCQQGVEDDERNFEDSELRHEVPYEHKTVSEVLESIGFDDDQYKLNQSKSKVNKTEQSRCIGPVLILLKVENLTRFFIFAYFGCAAIERGRIIVFSPLGLSYRNGHQES